ncbi:helix-turn-helix domain-containing protein [Fodinibius salinus]|uniref:helix-turn-helix domain-containing protein n=1 Tax=Fodinibius salinus TaxID=860790 RepID=UPI0011E6F6AB|nr:AraC family transcriptional regulator [Fodinibius salinus]
MSIYRKIIKQKLEDYRSQLSGCLLKMKNENGIPWPHEVTAVSRFISRRLYHPDLDISYMKDRGIIKSHRLSGQFEYYAGLKPKSYINLHRVSASQKLLRLPKLGKMSILKVAYHVGYRRPSTYIKAFKRQEGVSPGKWRKKS